MEKVKHIRSLIQLITSGVFLYQMILSFQRFNKHKVIQEKSMTTIDNIKKPVIYICQDNQFNYEKARKIGYQYMSTLAPGELNDTPKITWKGKFENLDNHKIFELLYESDYSDLSVIYSNAEKSYMAPHGWCMLLKSSNYTKEFIKTTKQSLILVVDPSKVNNLRTLEMDNGRIMFGPTESNLYDWSAYEISIRLYNSNINDGKSCTNYDILNSSYGECIEDAIQAVFMKYYGCLPPWFPSSTKYTCEDYLEVKIDKHTLPINISEDFKLMYYGRQMEMLNKCLPPCLIMKIKMKRTAYRSDRIDNAFFHYVFDNDVIVYTDAYAYEEFDLVVDLGSALGLWLGLSALSICDYIIHFCRKLCLFVFSKIQERLNTSKFVQQA